jgi:hypothetical protein
LEVCRTKAFWDGTQRAVRLRGRFDLGSDEAEGTCSGRVYPGKLQQPASILTGPVAEGADGEYTFQPEGSHPIGLGEAGELMGRTISVLP